MLCFSFRIQALLLLWCCFQFYCCHYTMLLSMWFQVCFFSIFMVLYPLICIINPYHLCYLWFPCRAQAVEVCNPKEQYLNHTTQIANAIPIADQVATCRLHWNGVVFGFMLQQFVNLMGQGHKTNKGLKDVHLNKWPRWWLSLVKGYAPVNKCATIWGTRGQYGWRYRSLRQLVEQGGMRIISWSL